MSIEKSLWFFGIPCALFAFLFWRILPFLDMMSGNVLFVTFLIGFGGPYLFLLLFSLRFYGKEKKGSSGLTLKKRFRLEALTGISWLWTLGLCVFVYLSCRLFAPTTEWIRSYLPSPPKYWVLLQEQDSLYFMEARYSWWVFAGYIGFSILRAFGTEFWWRGYILPRQELSFGKKAWFIHGILYTMFFVFMPWDLLRVFPSCLAIPFVAQMLKNTWPGVIAQMVVELPVLFGIISRM
jgi:hypothetical protein